MSGERTIGAVLLGIALAAFGVLALASRKLMSLERALDAGDVVVLGVFAAFGCFCAWLGWRLIRSRADSLAQPAPPPPATQECAPPTRVKFSHLCAAAGVVLLMLSVFLPAHWHPAAFLFLGLALLAVSHGLTPCVERLEQLRKARSLERHL
jgi:hypothetical protein